MIPSIETNRLKLLPPSIDSYPVYENFYTDPLASNQYGGPIGKEQIWARLKADIGSWYLLGFGVWIIQSRSNGELVGVCGFWQGKEWPKELTWWVLPQYRGLGIATEASRAVIDCAYNTFGWDAVHTYMNDDNEAARALVEKLGGLKVDRRTFNDGLSRDIYKIPEPSPI